MAFEGASALHASADTKEKNIKSRYLWNSSFAAYSFKLKKSDALDDNNLLGFIWIRYGENQKTYTHYCQTGLSEYNFSPVVLDFWPKIYRKILNYKKYQDKNSFGQAP